MNILHVWDQSGVACILAKYQSKLGHKSLVLRRSNYDPYGIYEFYNNLVEFADEEKYFELCLNRAMGADIVHVHSRADVLLYLRKKLSSKIKVIMHFHGSDLRGINQSYGNLKLTSIPKAIFKRYNSNKIRRKNNMEAIKASDKVIVSTPDLSKEIPNLNPIILTNPVDTEHFSKKNNGRTNSRGRFFTFRTEATSDVNWILNFCKDNGIKNLEVVDRIQNPIMYSYMPSFLQNYETYVDTRFVNNTLLENLSKTALECLSCGVAVIDYRLKKWSDLPTQNEPLIVANKVLELYEELS